MSSPLSYLQFAEYMDNLMEAAYGKEEFTKILEILEDLPQGLCGVEAYSYTFKKMLEARGVKPKYTYEQVMGYEPIQDGNDAATPRERQLIRETLESRGYSFEIPHLTEKSL